MDVTSTRGARQQYRSVETSRIQQTVEYLPTGIERLVKAGFGVHWLHARSKAPIGDDWAAKPVASLDKLRKTYRPGFNVGVRLGKWSSVSGYYLHVLDMDVRNPKFAAESRAALAEMFPDFESFPTVISGSGGESRHIYLLTERPFASKQLAHSAEKFTGKDGKKHWNWEIELFGTGKQVVLPPSVHPDTKRPYKWLQEFDFDSLILGDGPFVPADRIALLVEDPGDDTAPDAEAQQPLGLTVDETRALLSKLPNNDLDYDDWLNVMASVQHEAFGRSKDERKEFYEVFRAWSAQSSKHDNRETKYKFFSFKNRDTRRNRTMRSVQAEVRAVELEAEFDNLGDETTDDLDDEIEDLGEPESEPKGDFDDLLGSDTPAEPVTKRQQKLNKADMEAELGHVPPKIARLNKRHAFVFAGGKSFIVSENPDGSIGYGTVTDLHSLYENDRIATEKATEPVSKAWLRHKKRREFPNGITFAPNRVIKGAYNLWRGFSVEPDPRASCRLIISHIRKVICSNDPKAFNYCIRWLAHMIQRPEEKPGVAMVLRGKKGAGKDTVADYVGALFPSHHIKIGNQEQLVGKFNAHQEKCLLLHVEEGFWGGAKNAEGALKHLITSEKIMIEPKGLNAFSVDSYLRLFMSSNEEWVVPATSDERRYCVYDVSETRKGDHQYFAAIRNEMNNGGRAALLHYLLGVDLTGFNVRDVPNTAALAQQKVQGLKNFAAWWYGALQSGDFGATMLSTRRQGEANWHEDRVMVNRDEFREAYSRWMRARRHDGNELRHFEIGRKLTELTGGKADKARPRIDGQQQGVYIVPRLEESRRAFERWLGSELVWEDLPPPTSDNDHNDDFDDLDDLDDI